MSRHRYPVLLSSFASLVPYCAGYAQRSLEVGLGVSLLLCSVISGCDRDLDQPYAETPPPAAFDDGTLEGGSVHAENEQSSETSPIDQLDEMSADELADLYLNAVVSDEVAYEIIEFVSQLQADTAREFSAAAAEVLGLHEAAANGDRDAQILLNLIDFAGERGVTPLGLSQAEYDEFALSSPVVMAATEFDSEVAKAGCPFGSVSCSVDTFPTSLAGATCASGCIRATANDRTSNSSCEPVACDYRITFGGSGRTIDGRTSAADCAILRYDTVIATRTSRLRALVGFGGASRCLITGSGLQTNLQIR